MMAAAKMAGIKYGNLLAIEPVSKKSNGNIVWKFHCDCGNSCTLDGYPVRSGRVTTCQDCSSERRRKAIVKHGMTSTAEFGVWTDIQTRCYNKKSTGYENYGGRGISMCDRWREFENFFSDMGARPTKGHSIDRIDVNGNYEPKNCRWATNSVQANNKRNNRLITINGETKNLTQWANQSNITPTSILFRIKAGKQGGELIERSKRDGCLSFKGQTLTYREWSERTGIKQSTIASRIHTYGWTIEKALTEGKKL